MSFGVILNGMIFAKCLGLGFFYLARFRDPDLVQVRISEVGEIAGELPFTGKQEK